MKNLATKWHFVQEIYLATSFSAFFICFSKKRVRISWWILSLLLLPMVIDGTIQLISELTLLTNYSWLGTLDSPYYLSNNLIRAVTGLLFGTGTGLFLFSELKASIKLQD